MPLVSESLAVHSGNVMPLLAESACRRSGICILDDGWYERIGSEDNPLSDSIMDRIKYDAYKISIKAIDAKHDKSMREVYGLKASESH